MSNILMAYLIHFVKVPCTIMCIFCYRFEKVFEQKTKQDEIFDNVGKPVIDK